MSSELCKVVIVGDGAVGKTCLLSVYSTNEFPKDYVPTVFDNNDVLVKYAPLDKVVKVGLWDTAGQEEYDKLRYLSYLNAHYFIVCYSVDSRSSFENVVNRWLPELKKHAPKCKMVLVGTKVDLRGNEEFEKKLQEEDRGPMVTLEEGQAKAQEIQAKAFFECSAMENKGVHEIFEKIVELYFTSKKSGGCSLL